MFSLERSGISYRSFLIIARFPKRSTTNEIAWTRVAHYFRNHLADKLQLQEFRVARCISNAFARSIIVIVVAKSRDKKVHRSKRRAHKNRTNYSSQLIPLLARHIRYGEMTDVRTSGNLRSRESRLVRFCSHPVASIIHRLARITLAEDFTELVHLSMFRLRKSASFFCYPFPANDVQEKCSSDACRYFLLQRTAMYTYLTIYRDVSVLHFPVTNRDMLSF